MEYLSARKFAELVGVSNVQISKLVKQGRLPVNEKGQIPKDEGLAAYESGKRLGYENNREHNAQVRATKAARPSKNKSPPPPTDEPEYSPGDGDDVPLAPNGSSVSKRAADMYNIARAKKEAENAIMAKIKRQQIEKDLVDRNLVRAEAADIAARTKEILDTIPARISPKCEGKRASEIQGIIYDALQEAYGHINKMAAP